MRDRSKQKRKLIRESRRAARLKEGKEGHTETNPQLKKLVLETVENQLRMGDPPETRQTYERLIAAGYAHDKVMEMIGSALVGEIWTILKERKYFDRARYAALLNELR